jgi:hypothetical protein
MKKIINNPYLMDIIKVLIIFGTLRLLNIYHKSENNNLGLLILLIVVLSVRYFFRKHKTKLQN